MMDQKPKFIVVIGTSAGGFFALADLISQLNENMDAAFFVVMHLSNAGTTDYLITQMQKYTSLLCKEVEESCSIKKGTIYFPSCNKHLIVKYGKVKTGAGPEENRWRPSIDVLFRSGAAAYNGHTIGIILSGRLDDGTTGMSAIKRCGGCCIVQDPNEAEYPDMPLTVLKEIEVDYCIPLSEIGPTISTIIQTKKLISTDIPDSIRKEVDFAEQGGTIETLESLAEKTEFSCPDCGGVLFRLKNDSILRYKCHIGHSFTAKDLLSKQNKLIETSLWIAIRCLQERKRLFSQLLETDKKKGSKSNILFEEKIKEEQKIIAELKNILSANQNESDLII